MVYKLDWTSYNPFAICQCLLQTLCRWPMPGLNIPILCIWMFVNMSLWNNGSHPSLCVTVTSNSVDPIAWCFASPCSSDCHMHYFWNLAASTNTNQISSDVSCKSSYYQFKSQCSNLLSCMCGVGRVLGPTTMFWVEFARTRGLYMISWPWNSNEIVFMKCPCILNVLMLSYATQISWAMVPSWNFHDILHTLMKCPLTFHTTFNDIIMKFLMDSTVQFFRFLGGIPQNMIRVWCLGYEIIMKLCSWNAHEMWMSHCFHTQPKFHAPWYLHEISMTLSILSWSVHYHFIQRSWKSNEILVKFQMDSTIQFVVWYGWNSQKNAICVWDPGGVPQVFSFLVWVLIQTSSVKQKTDFSKKNWIFKK